MEGCCRPAGEQRKNHLTQTPTGQGPCEGWSRQGEQKEKMDGEPGRRELILEEGEEDVEEEIVEEEDEEVKEKMEEGYEDLAKKNVFDICCQGARFHGGRQGLDEFKEFLRDTPGEKVLHLWMDIERLTSTQHWERKDRYRGPNPPSPKNSTKLNTCNIH